jgi:hypothetical protein
VMISPVSCGFTCREKGCHASDCIRLAGPGLFAFGEGLQVEMKVGKKVRPCSLREESSGRKEKYGWRLVRLGV